MIQGEGVTTARRAPSSSPEVFSDPDGARRRPLETRRARASETRPLAHPLFDPERIRGGGRAPLRGLLVVAAALALLVGAAPAVVHAADRRSKPSPTREGSVLEAGAEAKRPARRVPPKRALDAPPELDLRPLDPGSGSGLAPTGRPEDAHLLVLRNFTIDGDRGHTDGREVELHFDYSQGSTQLADLEYRASETPGPPQGDWPGAAWQPLRRPAPFTLSDGLALKTVHFQLRGVDFSTGRRVHTAIQSDRILYDPTRVEGTVQFFFGGGTERGRGAKASLQEYFAAARAAGIDAPEPVSAPSEERRCTFTLDRRHIELRVPAGSPPSPGPYEPGPGPGVVPPAGPLGCGWPLGALRHPSFRIVSIDVDADPRRRPSFLGTTLDPPTIEAQAHRRASARLFLRRIVLEGPAELDWREAFRAGRLPPPSARDRRRR